MLDALYSSREPGKTIATEIIAEEADSSINFASVCTGAEGAAVCTGALLKLFFVRVRNHLLRR